MRNKDHFLIKSVLNDFKLYQPRKETPKRPRKRLENTDGVSLGNSVKIE